MNYFVRIEHKSTGLYLGIDEINTSLGQHLDWVTVIAVNPKQVESYEDMCLWEMITCNPGWNDYSRKLKHVKSGAYLCIRELIVENYAVAVFFEEKCPGFNIDVDFGTETTVSRKGDREYLFISSEGANTVIWAKADVTHKHPEDASFILHQVHYIAPFFWKSDENQSYDLTIDTTLTDGTQRGFDKDRSKSFTLNSPSRSKLTLNLPPIDIYGGSRAQWHGKIDLIKGGLAVTGSDTVGLNVRNDFTIGVDAEFSVVVNEILLGNPIGEAIEFKVDGNLFLNASKYHLDNLNLMINNYKSTSLGGGGGTISTLKNVNFTFDLKEPSADFYFSNLLGADIVFENIKFNLFSSGKCTLNMIGSGDNKELFDFMKYKYPKGLFNFVTWGSVDNKCEIFFFGLNNMFQFASLMQNELIAINGNHDLSYIENKITEVIFNGDEKGLLIKLRS